MFTIRLISGITLVLLSIVIVGQGGILLYTVTALISIIDLFEFHRALRIQRCSLTVVGYVTVCSYYELLWFRGQRYVTPMIIACLAAIMALYVLTFPGYKTGEMTDALFGVCYVPIILSFLCQARVMNDGAYLIWPISLSSWGCDAFIYCIGMLLGRYRLAPVLSPEKSVEGVMGGVTGAALLGFIYTLLLGDRMAELDNLQVVCATARVIAVAISQIGNSATSATKGDHNIKDHSHLILNHGGTLDRFDSIVFTAPAIYFVLTFLK